MTHKRSPRHSGRDNRRKPQRPREAKPKAAPKSPWQASISTDRVWMMPRDADHALVYWEITGASVARARALLERVDTDVQMVLRVRCNGTAKGTGAKTYDIPIDDWSGERYILLGPEGSEHFCAVGLRTLDSEKGVFMALGRSDKVRAPRRT